MQLCHTSVPDDFFPRPVGQNLHLQRSDQGGQGPESHCRVPGAGGHGEGTGRMARQT